MERIRIIPVALVAVVSQCVGASVCAAASQANAAEVIAPVSPHAPTAFWSGVVTLTVIAVARTLRRQLALLRYH